MDAGDLQTFEAVARLGGMGRAAIEIGTVQSNVSTRVRASRGGVDADYGDDPELVADMTVSAG
jgi:DNA-binding transcriptional LysR family regulator